MLVPEHLSSSLLLHMVAICVLSAPDISGPRFSAAGAAAPLLILPEPSIFGLYCQLFFTYPRLLLLQLCLV